MFCDKHNDKSRNLMLLPALQLSIPIILLFVNIPLEFPWWWRLGCVSVSRAACVAWGWAHDEHVVSGKLKILISSHLISIRPHFRSRDRRIISQSAPSNQRPTSGTWTNQSQGDDNILCPWQFNKYWVWWMSDDLVSPHVRTPDPQLQREETSRVLKETITHGIKISSYELRSAIENTPGLLLAGQIQSLKGSYPCTVGLHPPRGVIML